MNDQEKKKLFDAYSRVKGYDSWEQLMTSCLASFLPVQEMTGHIMNVCDIVQEAQQKRIADKVTIRYPYEDKNHWIDKDSIINPENLIK